MPQFEKKDYQFMIQGIVALQNECLKQKAALAEKVFTGDINTHTIIEYYDKRGAELQQLKIKLSGCFNP